MDTDTPGKPAYQRVADELRSQIATGKLPVGSAVRSMAQLMTEYRVSSTVARKAIDQLRAEGLVIGRPGKGVFVKSTPSEVAAESTTLESLTEELQELRQLVEKLANSTDDRIHNIGTRVDNLDNLVEDLRANAGLLRSTDEYGSTAEAR